jgi:signal transduction histidine kinase
MFDSIGKSDARARLLGFGLAVLAGLAFVIWIERSTWKQARLLQNEMAAIRTESFYLGVHLRAGIWRLDGRLLRFQLSEDREERESFLRESRELSEQIERTKPHLVTAREIELLQETEAAYKAYLADTTPLLDRGIRGIRRGTTEQLAREIAEKSAAVLRHCDNLVAAHHDAWESVLARSDRSVANVIRLMQGSALLMLALCVGLLALAYRAFFAPLRSQLSASTAVIQRQEKLASLGALATGVAHEIRNPLAAIKFRLFSFKESLSSGSADTEDLQIIGDEINRLERIVKDFLRFARPSEPELARVSGAALLQEVHGLLRGQMEHQSVNLVVESADDVWLHADKQQIQQVLINLAQNAAESLQGKGTVTLRARLGAARLAAGSQPVAILEVSDNGAGIPPEVEARLFDPFFSTKKGGTGLGLSIASRIVEKHGGHIQYQTQPNRGTTFSVLLPRWTDHATTDPAH